jgi:hypothetical protein
MAVRWAIASGDNNNVSTWNDGGTLGLPTSADSVFTNGFTVNMVADATYISMSNSARARDIATPAMTANNAPSPYVAAASSESVGFEAFRAFNRVYTTSTYWTTIGGATTGWLSMDFGSGIVIDSYTIYGSDSQTFNPRNWTFEGSNNNSTWTTLQTVALAAAIGGNSTYSSGNIGNTTGYRYYRVNVTLNGGGAGLRITELELYQQYTAALAAGGSFNFNTAGVTVSATSTSAITSGGIINITATTGIITLTLGGNINAGAAGVVISYTGNCNFNINSPNIIGGTSGGSNAFGINKSSTGTITITGNLTGGNGASNYSLNSTAGNTVVIGNVSAGAAGFGINQTAGNITVTGNVTGGTVSSIHGISLTGAASQFTINGNVTGGSGLTAHGINFGGTLGTVNGNVTGGGGSGARGITTDTGGVNVTGNCIGNVGIGLVVAANSTITGNVIANGERGLAIGVTGANLTINIIGDVYASTVASGVSAIGTGLQVVNLTGNMYNTLGRMAIWCPNVFISNTATTLWRLDTGGGDYKFLYSADTTPNLPATTNVRNGVTFGPALSLTGTMVVPSASDVRENVPTDNTVGTGELTSADIISGINASSDSLAVRLKNTLTDTTAGNIISQYNNS